VPLRTYYNWLEGNSAFPPDLIRRLSELTKDLRIGKFCLPKDVIAVPIVKIKSHVKKTIEQLGFESLFEASDAVETCIKVRRPESEGGTKVINKEKQECGTEIDEAIRKLVQLKMVIRQM